MKDSVLDHEKYIVYCKNSTLEDIFCFLQTKFLFGVFITDHPSPLPTSITKYATCYVDDKIFLNHTLIDNSLYYFKYWIKLFNKQNNHIMSYYSYQAKEFLYWMRTFLESILHARYTPNVNFKKLSYAMIRYISYSVIYDEKLLKTLLIQINFVQYRLI